MINLKIKMIDEKFLKPKKAHEEDAGIDVFSCEDVIIHAGQRHCFRLGFKMSFDNGYVALVQAKSGYAKTFGITTIGNVIDSNYRGECHAILLNSGQNIFDVKFGQKIAQIVFFKISISQPIFIEGELEETARGECGFGSTGNFKEN